MIKRMVVVIAMIVLGIISLVVINIQNSDWDITQADNKVHIEYFSRHDLPEGKTYTVKLINDSRYTILQNSVYMSFPIKKQEGQGFNPNKIEAAGNKLDIKPGEAIKLNIFVPKEVFKNYKNHDFLHPDVEIVGYFRDLKKENRFQKTENLIMLSYN